MKRVSNVWFIQQMVAFSTFPHLQNLEKEDQIQSVEAECKDERVKDDVTPKWVVLVRGNP